MARVLLHCPLNISRSLEQMIKEYAQEIQGKHDIKIEIITQPHRPTEDSLFEEYLRKAELPELIIGHVNDFAELPEGFIDKYFCSIPGRFPIKKELVDIGFIDERGYFHPFVVIPFAMFYNKNLLEENGIPHSWQNILEPDWQKKIRMPDDFRMVSTIIRTFMKATYPDRFNDFQANVVYQGSPIEVINAVDEGKYPIGITNIAFARISRNKNTRLIWPEDGIFCMPQVMVWSKEATQPLFEIGDFLMSAKIQEYLALQAFVPASPDIAVPHLLTDNNFSLHWEGWDHYLEVIKERNL